MSEPNLYEPLTAREFKSTIPAHLIHKLSDGERYMVETLSRLENQYDWMLAALLNQNKMVLDLARRQSHDEAWRSESSPKLAAAEKSTQDISHKVSSLWDWKNTMVGRTGVLLWLVTIILPLVLKFILDWLMRK